MDEKEMANFKQIILNRRFTSSLALILFISLFVIFFMISRVNNVSEHDANIIGSFIEWFGVLYGVLLALVVVEVWHKYAQINNEVDREADSLVLLLKTVDYLENNDKSNKLAKTALEYAQLMLNAGGDSDFQQSIAKQKLNEIHGSVGNILNNKEIPMPLSLEILRYINDAIDLRGDWFARAQERMPRGLWAIVIATSIFWLLGFFGLSVDNELLAFTLCGVSTFTVLSIIFIVADIDNPIGGIWKVRFDSFQILKNEAERLINKTS